MFKNLLFFTTGALLAVFGGFVSSSLDAQNRGKVGVFEKIVCNRIVVEGSEAKTEITDGEIVLNKYASPGGTKIVAKNKISYNGMFPEDGSAEGFFAANGINFSAGNAKISIGIFERKLAKALNIGIGDVAHLSISGSSGTCGMSTDAAATNIQITDSNGNLLWSAR